MPPSLSGMEVVQGNAITTPFPSRSSRGPPCVTCIDIALGSGKHPQTRLLAGRRRASAGVHATRRMALTPRPVTTSLPALHDMPPLSCYGSALSGGHGPRVVCTNSRAVPNLLAADMVFHGAGHAAPPPAHTVVALVARDRRAR